MKSKDQQRQPLRLTLLLQPCASRPGSLLGVEAPVPLLAIEEAKSDEHCKAADMISGALDQLGEQLQ